METIIFHIDVNSAYLSWSAIKRLEAGDTVDLRTIPSIVGGDIQKRHGVVLAKSIPAKKYGVTTGEPIVNALRKCPSLVLEAPDHQLYHQRSRQLMEYLTSVCPEIEQLSVDECFMDYTPIRNRFPSPESAADMIKEQVKERFGFTVNIGISDKKVLAKMASDFQKPDRVHTLYSYEIKEKMWPLPVSCLYMCGRSSVQALLNLGIRTIGELAQTDRNVLSSHMKSHGIMLWEYANGIDDSTVSSAPAEAKGIGNSTTLPKDVTDKSEAYKCLLALSDSVAGRLREAGQLAGMISVEIKYSSFRTASHQMALSAPSNTSQILYQAACRLFDELWDEEPIRLLGIRSAKLVDQSQPTQLSLFDLALKADSSSGDDHLSASKTGVISESKNSPVHPSKEKLAALDQTLDTIRKKYGENAIIRGSLLKDHPQK